VSGFFDSVFHRRSRSVTPSHLRLSEAPPAERQQLFRIDFDMMLKGSICNRRRQVVRQFGVTVNGSTRLVTSGDTVDIDTYKALLAAGAIRPALTEGPATLSESEAVVDYTALKRSED